MVAELANAEVPEGAGDWVDFGALRVGDIVSVWWDNAGGAPIVGIEPGPATSEPLGVIVFSTALNGQGHGGVRKTVYAGARFLRRPPGFQHPHGPFAE